MTPAQNRLLMGKPEITERAELRRPPLGTGFFLKMVSEETECVKEQ
jgi:hypothetical protein